jgi:arylsulfatase B
VLEGTNLNYTMFPEKLQKSGYATHMVGKWHQGFYAPQYLPTSRGFDSYLGFLSGCEDHLNQLNCCGPCNTTK